MDLGVASKPCGTRPPTLPTVMERVMLEPPKHCDDSELLQDKVEWTSTGAHTSVKMSVYNEYAT